MVQSEGMQLLPDETSDPSSEEACIVSICVGITVLPCGHTQYCTVPVQMGPPRPLSDPSQTPYDHSACAKTHLPNLT